MSENRRGGFRPPEISTLVTKCPACETFNSAKATKCKKCGADLTKKDTEKK